MKMKFCAKCGRKGETKEGLCDRCYSEEHPSLISFKDIKVSVCSNCGKGLFKNKWTKFGSVKDVVKKAVKERIKGDRKVVIAPMIKKGERKGEVSIKVIGMDEGYVIPCSVNYVVCPVCSREDSEYYEGILQLRDVSREVINYCMNDVKKQMEKGIFFTKIEELKNGVDLYCTSNNYIRSLANRLKKKFKGEVKISPHLYGRNRQKSKDVYRLNVLFRMKG